MADIQFPITIKIIEESDAVDAPFVAHIPEFDISSCGKTEQEAIDHAKEALDILLEEIKSQGKLEQFLHEQGIRSPGNSLMLLPKLIIEPFRFSV